MSGLDLFFWSAEIVPAICVGAHFVLAINERSGPMARLLLLGLGCLLPLLFMLQFFLGTNASIQPRLLLLTMLVPGSWLILASTLGLIVDVGLRGRLPTAITTTLVVMSYLGVAANLFFAALWMTSDT